MHVEDHETTYIYTDKDVKIKGGLLVLYGFGQMDFHLWPPAARPQHLLWGKLETKMLKERVSAFYVLGSSGVMEQNSSLLILCWQIKAPFWCFYYCWCNLLTLSPLYHYSLCAVYNTQLAPNQETFTLMLIILLHDRNIETGWEFISFSLSYFSFTWSRPSCLWTFSPYWDFSCVVSTCPPLLSVLYLCAPTRLSHLVVSLSLLLSQFPLLLFFFL